MKANQGFKSIVTLKNISILFILLFVLSLLPIIFISFFNHPCADDFAYGAQTHMQFLNAKSLFGLVNAASQVSQHFYNSWQGTYSAAFIMSLQPSIFGENFYPITTFIMLFMLIAPTFFLLHTIIVKVYKLDWKYIVIIGVPILFFSTQYLPSLVQGFFWYNGSVYYTFYYGIMVYLLAMCVRIYKQGFLNSSKTKVLFSIKFLLCALACFIIGGGNYVTALLTPILVSIIVILCFITRKPLILKSTFIVLLIILLAGLAISAIAPGNAVRQAAFTNQQGVFKTILFSFREALRNIISSFDLRIICTLVLLTPAFYIISKKTRHTFRYPLLVFILSLCLFSAQYAPTMFAMGGIGGGRLQNIIYYSLIWLFFFNYFYLIGWLGVLLRKHSIYIEKTPIRRWAGAAIFLVFMFLIANYFTAKSSSAYICTKDILNGSAKQYSNEINERYAVLHNKDIKQVELKPLTVKPEALFFDDITTDKSDWRNYLMASYYQKESVVLIDDTAD